MRIGIVSATAIAKEDNLTARRYLGSEKEDHEVEVARKRVRLAIANYRRAQAVARERAQQRAKQGERR